MDCLACAHKRCKSEGQDCNQRQDEVLDLYRDPEARETYCQADGLVAHGRAGTLSRAEEIAEYALARGYRKIALAYCYALEGLAAEYRQYLRDRGLASESFRCTLNGIRENQVAPELGPNVNCNPLGQALAINAGDADLVVEMGLCLGHDILFHQHLDKPFTVLIVKDRKFGHHPARAFKSYQDPHPANTNK